jgi:enolase
MRIDSFSCRKILNSRCEWTIETEINGFRGSAPSGASKGKYEALVVSADKAVGNAKSLKLIGKSFTQDSFDSFLAKSDRTKNFSKLGGNTSTALSFAFYNSTFKLKNNTFPFPLGNVFGGGMHGGFTDIQEFLILPYKAKTPYQAAQTNVNFYRKMASILRKPGTNDEGALTARMPDSKVFELLMRIKEDIPVKIGIDFASSSLWNGKSYIYRNSRNKSSGEQVDYLKDIIKTYNLFYVEDGLHEDDFAGFSELRKKISKKTKTLICGDDLTVTNVERLKTAVRKKAINAVIIKPNQAGTITLAKKAVQYSRRNKILPVVSHRSGETTDVTISRLAVNMGIPILKAGIFGSRAVKMDEVIRLWEEAEKPRMAKL